MVPNDEPKSVNIHKISTALHAYYLNLIVNYLNTVQIAQIQAYNFECIPCSDAISETPLEQAVRTQVVNSLWTNLLELVRRFVRFTCVDNKPIIFKLRK